MSENDAWIRSQIAWNYGMLKRHEEAIALFSALISEHYENGWLYANLAWNYLEEKKTQKAYAALLKAKAYDPEDEWIREQLAHMETDRRQL